MTVVLGGLAIACLLAAALLLRSIGPAYGIARRLAGTPAVSLDEALEVAASGQSRYLRVDGRVSSDEEFPDEHDRPLVYRRSRLEVGQPGGRWRVIARDSEAVAFGVEARGSYLGVDAAALGEGLVVVPREAVGQVSDLDPELAAGEDPQAASRLVVEQISAVEHAVVVGVPRLDEDGAPVIGAGLGRPLILTTVEVPAAMRLLARGRRTEVLATAVLLASGTGLAVAALVVLLITG